MRAKILSVGLTAPGLVNFESFKIMMKANQSPDTNLTLEKYSPTFLPANERRRTTATIKLALKTAEEALLNFRVLNPESDVQIPVLFVCKDGDTLISAKMCQTVSEQDPMISPTQFHNSVHNAPAGYWMIGQGNQAPASAISASEFAIANGLLEAVLQSKSYAKPVLVVIYDLPMDELMPVDSVHKSHLPFAFAFILDASYVDVDDGVESQYPTLELSVTQDFLPESFENNPYKGLPAADGYSLLKAIALHDDAADDFEISYPLNRNNFVKVSLI